jgi:hypothetical protein
MPELSDLIKSLSNQPASFDSADVRRRVKQRQARRRTVAAAFGTAALFGAAVLTWQLARPEPSLEIRVIAPAPENSTPVSVEPATTLKVPDVLPSPTTPPPSPQSTALISVGDQRFEVDEQIPCEPNGATCAVSGDLKRLTVAPGETIALTVDTTDYWELVQATFGDLGFDGQLGSVGTATFNILANDQTEVLRIWVAPRREAPIGNWNSRLFAVEVTVTEVAPVDLALVPATTLTAGDEPPDLPSQLALYSYESNTLVLRDRETDDDFALNSFGGPLDPSGDSICADGCGGWNLIYDAGAPEIRYTGAGAGPGTPIVQSTRCDLPESQCEDGRPVVRQEAMFRSVLAQDSLSRDLLVDEFLTISRRQPGSTELAVLSTSFKRYGIRAGTFSRDGSAAFVIENISGRIWRLDSQPLGAYISLFADLGAGVGSMEALASGVLVVSRTAVDDGGRLTGPTSLISLDITTGDVVSVSTIDRTAYIVDVDASGRYLLLASIDDGQDQLTDGTILWTDLSTNQFGVIGAGSDAAW